MPDLLAGACLLVVSHGNTLRALVKHLDGLTVGEVADLENAISVIRVYELGPACSPFSGGRRHARRPEHLQWRGPHDLPNRGTSGSLAWASRTGSPLGRHLSLERGQRADMHRDMTVLNDVEAGVDRAHPLRLGTPSRTSRPGPTRRRTGAGP